MDSLVTCSSSACKSYFSGSCRARTFSYLFYFQVCNSSHYSWLLLHAMMAVRGESKILGYNAQYSLFGNLPSWHEMYQAGRPLIVQTRGSITYLCTSSIACYVTSKTCIGFGSRHCVFVCENIILTIHDVGPLLSGYQPYVYGLTLSAFSCWAT